VNNARIGTRGRAGAGAPLDSPRVRIGRWPASLRADTLGAHCWAEGAKARNLS